MGTSLTQTLGTVEKMHPICLEDHVQGVRKDSTHVNQC